MKPARASGRRFARALMCAGAMTLVLLPAGLGLAPARAQQIEIPGDVGGGQLFLEADTLTYDNDSGVVTAAGSVRIEYNGYRLVADRVAYDQKSGRLMASGGVELIDPKGTKISSDEIDITDDFKDGFVNALRVETADKVYFGAESAKREDGEVTTFSNGIYTACEPCEDDPDKAPIWRIKATKIIWNGKTKKIRFEKPRFEFFGHPIAALPFFEISDPTVKRKTGFLIGSVTHDTSLGYGARLPYYFALSPTYDLTVTGSYYTRQGFLGEAEWRQRFDNGSIILKAAGIIQRSPGAFAANTVDRGETARGMIGTKGDFKPNDKWAFGWDLLLQSDKNFSRTYKIDGFNQYIHRSEVFLTGLGERNHFDLRAQRYTVQEKLLDTNANARNAKQPWVLPSFDYSITPDTPVAGGELSFDFNGRFLGRNALDSDATSIPGMEGRNGRITGEVEWKRTFILPGGLALTPIVAARADAIFTDYSAASVLAMQGLDPAADIRAAYYRTMATAGLELRWPILFSTSSASHVLEPMAQIFLRPNEQHAANLGIPNEDAQSLVFDAATLFDRDKFSGLDRIEGGIRANVGIRYSGTFGNGWYANALFGQSYHLAGTNSYASPDLVNVGAFSGLESARSDFVGMIALGNGSGQSASIKARLDEKTFALRRLEAAAGFTSSRLSGSLRYAFIQAQPGYGYPVDRQEIALAATAHLTDRWKVFGSGVYDLQSNVLVKDSLGFGYDDECFAYSLTLNETRRISNPSDVTRSIGFFISLRTLGDFSTNSSALTNVIN